jgi:hypothetical protein
MGGMMATKMRLTFVSEGFHEILCSDEVKKIVEEKAEEIRARAESSAIDGSEFISGSFIGNMGGGRVIGTASTGNYLASLSEAEDKVLSKAVG